MNYLIPFGKYKGKNLENLLMDENYIKWLQNQVWVQEKYPIIYNIIHQVNFEDQPSPEHNAMQIKWLDKNYIENFLDYYDSFDNTYAKYKNYIFLLNNINWKFERKYEECIFESKGDVSLKISLNPIPINDELFDIANKKFQKKINEKINDLNNILKPSTTIILEEIEDRIEKLKEKTFLPKCMGIINNIEIDIELKPIIGDDYPAILRKIKRQNIDVLICQKFESSVISLKQAKQFFKTNDILFLLESEFENK